MSEIKDQAKKLKEMAKKYGYELKHTHALEIISQLEFGTNRHVALKNEKPNPLEINFHDLKNSFEFEVRVNSTLTEMVSGYVIELIDHNELVYFLVATDPCLDLEFLSKECGSQIQSLRVLSEKEVSKSGFEFEFYDEDSDEEKKVPYNSLLEWIKADFKKNHEEFPFILKN